MKPGQNRLPAMVVGIAGGLVAVWLGIALAPGIDSGLAGMFSALNRAMANPFRFQFVPDTPRCVLVCLFLYGLGVLLFVSSGMNFRRGEEYGSAKWGSTRAIDRKYRDRKNPNAKLFVRFILSKYAIGVAWKLVNGIFAITGALITKVFAPSGLTDGNMWAGVTAPNFDDTGILKIITNLMAVINPLSQIPSLLLGLIGFIVAVVLSVTLLLTVIGRFFKIYLFAALSPLPLATFGSESTHSIGQNFLKSFAGVSLEGLTVGLSLIVFSAYCQSPVIDFSGLGIFMSAQMCLN